jgi:TolB-like protein/Flp pilus assembly protein TadD
MEGAGLGGLLDELKRRNVIRVGVAYVVATWVLLQVADLALDNISAPNWVMQVFMLALGLGFPLVLVFSWAFELTPEGLKRETEIPRSESVTGYTARKLDRITIGLLVLVLVIFGVERFLLPAREAPAETGKIAAVAEKSIAVLAFEDLSAGGDQQYFAEGISEELLNVLAQIPGLNVAGRTSSFAFKNQDRDLREIGEILEVEHILEGSLRTSGNRIRVTAQLVRADNGFHLFSKNYDRELTEIFEVQDEIAREIGAALRTVIMGDADIDKATPTPVESYNYYLQARQWIHSRDKHLMERASAVLDEALTIDPNYAPALAQKALVTQLLSDSGGSYGDVPWKVAREIARPLLDRALEIDPGLAEGHAVLGLWYSQNTIGPSEDAERHLRRALEINPTMANANNWLASEFSFVASINESRRLYETVVQHDPLYAPAFNNLMFSYLQTREIDKADSLIRRVQRITGDSPNVNFARGSLAKASGDLSTATRELNTAYEANPTGSVVQIWYATATYFLGDYERSAEVSVPVDSLVALELAGRHDEAVAVFESVKDGLLGNGDFRAISDWFLLLDRADELVAFHENYFEGRGDWVSFYPEPNELWGASAFTRLSQALRQVGRDSDAQQVLDRALEIVELQRKNGADNLFFWFNDAELGAMTGDRARMLRALRNAIDTGYLDVVGCASLAFETFRQDARFIELEEEMIRRATNERRELESMAM